jgi:hypothetical protein
MVPRGTEQVRAADLPLPTQWPADFFVGGGLGGSPVSEWELRIWLAHAAGEVAPSVGAPHAALQIDTACLDNGSCQVAYVPDIVLAP